jgi:Icc-related predicted phosphoesterase
VRVAAIGDLHTRPASNGLIRSLLEGLEGKADVLILAGDLTDNGDPEEAKLLVEELSFLKIPILAVLGNHDHESGKADELAEIFREGGIIMLDGTSYELEGVGFVGTKGFCGGFGKTLIQPFGEAALKTFIKTSIDEAIQLENALVKLDACSRRVAVLHYAPIRETLLGEPEELFPFLGSSRLCNALDRQGVSLIVHGHAHHGSPFGTTSTGIPVHNVSRFVQLQHNGHAYCIFDI